MKNIRNIIGIAVIAAASLAACSSAVDNSNKAPIETAEASTPAKDEQGLPSFTMKDIAGNDVNLQSLKGKKVFVNLWASWCPPCRAEMPSIEKLYAAVNKDNVAFVMLSFDENPETAKQYKDKNKLSVPVFFPSEQPPAMFNTDGIPATFIFNEQGSLIKQNFGAEDYDTEDYRQLLK